MRFYKAAGYFCAFVMLSHPGFASAGGGEKATSNYVNMKPILLPVLSNGNIEQFVTVTVTLEMDDPAAASKVTAIQPKLMDAYVQDLYRALDSRKVMHGETVDPGAIKTALEASNTRILGDMPCKVLLQNIGQRAVRG